jgi:hypothetical protein
MVLQYQYNSSGIFQLNIKLSSQAEAIKLNVIAQNLDAAQTIKNFPNEIITQFETEQICSSQRAVARRSPSFAYHLTET